MVCRAIHRHSRSLATGSKADKLGDSKAVKDMVDLEVVDILA